MVESKEFHLLYVEDEFYTRRDAWVWMSALRSICKLER